MGSSQTDGHVTLEIETFGYIWIREIKMEQVQTKWKMDEDGIYREHIYIYIYRLYI